MLCTISAQASKGNDTGQSFHDANVSFFLNCHLTVNAAASVLRTDGRPIIQSLLVTSLGDSQEQDILTVKETHAIKETQAPRTRVQPSPASCSGGGLVGGFGRECRKGRRQMSCKYSCGKGLDCAGLCTKRQTVRVLLTKNVERWPSSCAMKIAGQRHQSPTRSLPLN